jgi:hypothetical protein
MNDRPSTGEPLLPIKLDTATNGEYAPAPLQTTVAAARDLAADRLATNARRTGKSRRGFMASLCGAATTLLTLNEAWAARGNIGGQFALPPESAVEPEAAQALAGREFIFDIQTHFIEANGVAWRRGDPREGARGLEGLRAALGIGPKECAGGPGLK